MRNINETQRKYLRKRLESKYNELIYKVDSQKVIPQVTTKERVAYINKELKRAGLDWTVCGSYNDARNIELPMDREYTKQRNGQLKKIAAKKVELKEVYNSLLDDLILGEDVDELKAALASFDSFNTEMV